MADVVVAGQGYVGLPLAIRAAEVGHRVVGYDVDPHRVKQLAAGESYVEDVASARVRAALDSGAYSATSDAAALAGFDLAVITVPTTYGDPEGRPSRPQRLNVAPPLLERDRIFGSVDEM